MSSEIVRHGIQKRWSDVVCHRGVAYFVEVPDDSSAPPESQFDQVLQQVAATLERLGSKVENLLQVIVYLPYPEDLAAFNERWDAWVPFGHAPSRACLHSPLVSSAMRVELVVTGAID
ncbi:Rid family hydrolase [Planctomicrobium sp. SH668]|uniref:Rid family hydrolase n=1 Tax=Planctomicrobium sp. SH668 TaxID=3448126 RepID=UPI003F5C09A3